MFFLIFTCTYVDSEYSKSSTVRQKEIVKMLNKEYYTTPFTKHKRVFNYELLIRNDENDRTAIVY